MKALLFVCVCAVALTAAVVYAQGTHRTVTLFVQDICLLCIYLQVAPLSIARYVLYSFVGVTPCIVYYAACGLAR